MAKFLSVVVVLIVLLCIQPIQFSWCSEEQSSSGCLSSEREALLKFKQGLIDPSNRLSSWVGEDCCTWQGIGCDNITGHVVKLNVRNPFPFDYERHLKGKGGSDAVYSKACLIGVEVNPSLLELKHLKSLDLSWNNFSAIAIPKFFGSFKELRYLNLSTALFRGIIPPHLGNLSTLLSLDLSSHNFFKLHGGIAIYPLSDFELSIENLQWASHLTSLQQLDMSGLNLSNMASDWPQVVNLLPYLKELHLPNCELEEIHLTFPSHFNFTALSLLNLSYNKFQGPIPKALWNMTSLKFLDLSHNEFSAIDPTLDVLENSCSLKASEYCFGNSSSSYFMNSLETLDLSRNELSGHLPSWLGQFKSLNYLDLSTNSLYGTIPTSFGNLSMLRLLDLDSNQLNGTIPKSLGDLSKLEVLNFYQNSLEGDVSDIHFAKLSKLEYLDMSFNYLVLKVGSNWIPPFQLKFIYLSSCKMGPQFPNWLETQTSVVYLDISNASISDSIPDWFRNLPSQLYHIDLSHNDIHGKVPAFSTSISANKLELVLSSNIFEGPLPNFPSTVVLLDLSNNSISGPIPQNIGDMLPNLKFLLLSNNRINSSIPISLCAMKTLLYLDISKNHLFGNLPQCWSDFQELIIVDLSSNKLSGVIPSSISHLQSLSSLHLNNNNFSGELPLGMKNCTRLNFLDLGENKLSGNIPIWMGKSLSLLQILRLRSNMLDGVIPSQLCHLTSLQIMDLAGNYLSGTIPRCFDNFSVMVSGETRYLDYLFGDVDYEDRLNQVIKGREFEYKEMLGLLINMDLSNNNLVGDIPKEITMLSGLCGLNLSRNHLAGSIPENIGELKSLESLDFSLNQLLGTIPQSLSILTSLNHINLSYNDLSGRIPSGSQLQTLNDPTIYEGNPKLCGHPLEKKCLDDEPPQAPIPDDRKGKGEPKFDSFYVGMVSGFVVGICGFFGVLLFKKPWRSTYSQFVDDMNDTLISLIAVSTSRLKKISSAT